MNGTDLQIDRLEGSERPLHTAQQLVTAHCAWRIQAFLWQTRSNHVDAVEGGLGRDLVVPQLEAEAGVFDVECEVLAHLVLVYYEAHAHADFILPDQITSGHHCLDLVEFLPGSLDEGLPRVDTPIGHEGVAADNEPFAGVIGVDELDQIAFVEQAQLNRPVLDELANLDGLECADPSQSLDVFELIDLLLADHPPVSNHDKVLQAERALDFFHFRHE